MFNSEDFKMRFYSKKKLKVLRIQIKNYKNKQLINEFKFY